MTDNAPYDQGNDEWLLGKIKLDGIHQAASCFTRLECYRVLYMAAEGKLHINRNGQLRLESRIRALERGERDAAAFLAKTKNK